MIKILQWGFIGMAIMLSVPLFMLVATFSLFVWNAEPWDMACDAMNKVFGVFKLS